MGLLSRIRRAVSRATTIYISLADDAPPQAEGYSGRSYRVAHTWTPDGLRGKALWSWLLYGHVDALDGEQRAIVWVRADG